jgi:hypothetical protein
MVLGISKFSKLITLDYQDRLNLMHLYTIFLNISIKYALYNCDRITSEMRGLSPKIISGDSRRSENAQTHTYKHTVPNMKFKL